VAEGAEVEGSVVDGPVVEGTVVDSDDETASALSADEAGAEAKA
jgi:hypothetical protein